MKKILKGTGVALVTPFKNDKSIDFEAIGRMVNHVIAGGVDYIVALGTTGETPTLSFAERKQILDTIIECTALRVPIVVGIGTNNPLEVNEQIHYFDLSKVSAILSVAPYYNKPQQRGLIGHYQCIASHSSLPIILYNVPGRAGVNIAADTTLEIARTIPNVIGIKEASGNMFQIMHILHNRPEDFLVISGDDMLTLPLLACGADGVISVIANAFPNEFSAMVHAGINGRFDEVLPQLTALACNDAMKKACNELAFIAASLKKSAVADRLCIDLSVVNNTEYYNGIIFQGYVEKAPSAVLTGGRYDKLAGKLRENTQAIGFAVYLDNLNLYYKKKRDFDSDILILFDSANSSESLLALVESFVDKGFSVRVEHTMPEGYRAKTVYAFENGALREVTAC